MAEEENGRFSAVQGSCDNFYRRLCCQPFVWCQYRRTIPSDPWFEAEVNTDWVVSLDRVDGTKLNTKHLEEAIVERTGRVKPSSISVAGTSDASGWIPSHSNHSFQVIQKIFIDPKNGRARIEVWPDYAYKANHVMRNLEDKFGVPVATHMLSTAAEAPLTTCQPGSSTKA